MAQKGRMVEVGRTAVTVLLQRNRASLVILAADASEKLKKEIESECIRKRVPVYIFSNKIELGNLFGRDALGTIAISNKNLAAGIAKVLDSP